MPPSGKIEVAEEGNKRRGEMSPAEVRQCSKDIVEWFRKHADLDAVGTPSDDVDRMAKRRALPLALEELYLSAKDGIWFEDKELIALQACGKLLGEIDEPYFPFARDVDDNMLVVDCKNEAVYEWDLADGRGDEVERSITDYLEGYRNKLLENKYEYMDGDGCIEKAGGSSAPPPRGK